MPYQVAASKFGSTVSARVGASLRLGVEKGCAALRIIRRYYDVAGELFEASVTVHPADRFAVTMRLERARA